MNDAAYLRRLHDAGALMFMRHTGAARDFEIVGGDKPGDEVYRATITTPALDSYDSVIHPDGGDFMRFQANPVVYLDHGWMVGELPIGKALTVEPMADRIEASFVLANGDPLADRARNLMKQGILRGTSIGFVPLKIDFADEPMATPDAEPRMVLHVRRWEMLEFSVAGIPSNPEALIHSQRADVVRFPSPSAEARSYVASIIELLVKGAKRGDIAEACELLLPPVYDTSLSEIENGRTAKLALDYAIEFARRRGDAETAALIYACIDTADNCPEA